MATNVKTQVQELLAICKDENRGIDSAEAKAILAELAKENVNIKQQILRVDPSSYKAYAEQISSAINDLRKDNSAPESSEPQGKKEEKTADPEVKTPTVVKEDNAPETESNTPEEQLSDTQRKKLEKFASIAKKMEIDISAVTPNNFGRTLSELERRQVTIDLREYIFGRADKCSDFATDYIEAKGIKTQYQKKHWQEVLGVLENAIKPQKNGAEPNTDRLVEIATKVSEISTNKKITEQASEFLKKITSQSEKQGEEKMAEDNQNIETTTENENTPVSEEKTPAYKPSETYAKMARIANVGLEGIENDDALIAAINATREYVVEDNKLLKLDGSNKTEVNIDKEIEKLDEEAEKKANPIEFSAMEGDTPTPTPTENEDNKWIAEKIAYYNSLSEAQKINNYVHDESITDGFAASFNDAKIHYTTKTNVAVSKDALYSVYDVMLKDPHNVGRPVNFSDNMTPEMAARLYAACIVNGNEMGGAVPQLTDEMKNQLKEEMGEEAYAVFEAKLAARTQNAPEPNSQAQQEKTEPTAEEIKQAMKDQYKMSVMENNGTIKKTADGYEKGENGSDEALQEYKEMSERAQTGKPMLFEQFKKSPEEFRKLMSEVIDEEKLHDKIDQLKLKRLKGKETKDEMDARREENKNIIKASLGIIDSYTDSNGVEHKKLESDDELIAYIKRQKISEYSYHNLGGKDDHVKALVADHGFNVKNTGHENVNS